MFYSKLILVNQGPLVDVWLAAHWTKKLTKQKITQLNLSKSIEDILKMEVPLSLRLSGHLLLGVIRIYSKKVQYLATDCNEALVKIKLAFRPGEVQIDLRPEAAVAPYSAITLHLPTEELEIQPELPLAEIDESALVNLNKATKKQISLQPRPVEQEAEVWNETAEFDPLMVEEGEEVTRPAVQPSPRGEIPEEYGGGVIQPEELETLRGLTPQKEGVGQLPPEGEKGVGTPTAEAELIRKQREGLEEGVAPGEQPRPSIGVVEAQEMLEKVKRPTKRKIGVIMDESLIISSSAFKEQLADTSALLRDVVPAPPSKKAMLRRERHLQHEQALYRPLIPGLHPQLASYFEGLREKTLEERRKALEPSPVKEVPVQEEEEQGVIAPDYEAGMVPPPEEVEKEEEGEEERPREVTEIPERRARDESRFRAILQTKFQTQQEIVFQDFVKDLSRNVVVQSFLGVLSSASKDYIKVNQDEPYGPIVIRSTSKLMQETFLPKGQEVPAH